MQPLFLIQCITKTASSHATLLDSSSFIHLRCNDNCQVRWRWLHGWGWFKCSVAEEQWVLRHQGGGALAWKRAVVKTRARGKRKMFFYKLWCPISTAYKVLRCMKWQVLKNPIWTFLARFHKFEDIAVQCCGREDQRARCNMLF